MKIDGEYLSHLRFADDIFIFIHHINYNKMLHEFADESKNQGVKMNNSKRKVMMKNGRRGERGMGDGGSTKHDL